MITCCVHVIEVIGVSLLVPSRIGIIMYGFIHPMLLCRTRVRTHVGPGTDLLERSFRYLISQV